MKKVLIQWLITAATALPFTVYFGWPWFVDFAVFMFVGMVVSVAMHVWTLEE